MQSEVSFLTSLTAPRLVHQSSLQLRHSGAQRVGEQVSIARFTWKRRTSSSSLPPSSNMQGQRRNLSRDRNNHSYAPGYQGGRGGNAWDGARNAQALNNQQLGGTVEEHVPVRGFNNREVSDYLNRGFVAALTAAQNPYGDEASKPLIYKSPEKPWSTTRTGGSAWGIRQHVMANGSQFLTQLRKGVDNLPPAKE